MAVKLVCFLQQEGFKALEFEFLQRGNRENILKSSGNWYGNKESVI